MKNQRKFLIACLIALMVVLYSSMIFAAAPNTCITCHTNESLMKSLHKPPPMPVSEGEG
jgi:hypothetical protein